MKYFLTTTIINEDGGIVATLEDREITADEVITELAVRRDDNKDPVLLAKAGRTCSNCGKPGHSKRTCPKAAPTKSKKGKRTVTCKNCGEQGHLQKTCPNAPAPAAEQPAVKSEPFGRDTYEQVRGAMHDREFQSARYALVNKLSPREVNASIKSTDFEDYLLNR